MKISGVKSYGTVCWLVECSSGQDKLAAAKCASGQVVEAADGGGDVVVHVGYLNFLNLECIG
jgi:hypothetical protein